MHCIASYIWDGLHSTIYLRGRIHKVRLTDRSRHIRKVPSPNPTCHPSEVRHGGGVFPNRDDGGGVPNLPLLLGDDDDVPLPTLLRGALLRGARLRGARLRVASLTFKSEETV